MPEAEGTIRFHYDLEPMPGPPAAAGLIRSLLAWRSVLHRLKLVGQAPDRYGGFGYGNLSARDTDHPAQFIVTASQTSGMEDLPADGLCRIREFDLDRFRVLAQGSRPPSSEALTHAMIYAADPRANWVLHAHCPELWQQAEDLGLPATAADIPYGSAEMAHAVAALLATRPERPLVFVSRGHQDGVFACGPSADETGGLLVNYLTRALGRLAAAGTEQGSSAMRPHNGYLATDADHRGVP